MSEKEEAGEEPPLPWPSPSSCLARQSGQTPDSLGETLLPFYPPTRLLHSFLARASPVATFAANDVDKVHMGEHRVAVHGIRQRVRFAPFERPRGEGSRALSAPVSAFTHHTTHIGMPPIRYRNSQTS